MLGFSLLVYATLQMALYNSIVLKHEYKLMLYIMMVFSHILLSDNLTM